MSPTPFQQEPLSAVTPEQVAQDVQQCKKQLEQLSQVLLQVCEGVNKCREQLAQVGETLSELLPEEQDVKQQSEQGRSEWKRKEQQEQEKLLNGETDIEQAYAEQERKPPQELEELEEWQKRLEQGEAARDREALELRQAELNRLQLQPGVCSSYIFDM